MNKNFGYLNKKITDGGEPSAEQEDWKT